LPENKKTITDENREIVNYCNRRGIPLTKRLKMLINSIFTPKKQTTIGEILVLHYILKMDLDIYDASCSVVMFKGNELKQTRDRSVASLFNEVSNIQLPENMGLELMASPQFEPIYNSPFQFSPNSEVNNREEVLNNEDENNREKVLNETNGDENNENENNGDENNGDENNENEVLNNENENNGDDLFRTYSKINFKTPNK
jgi:hypothetical protein